MKQTNLENKILYLSFHNSIKKIYGINRIVTRKELMSKLGRQFLVPKPLRILAIKELEEMGLLKKESKNEFKILDCDLNIEEDANKFLRRMNIFGVFTAIK